MLCLLPPKQSNLKMPPFLQSSSLLPPKNMSNLSLFPFFVLFLLLTFSAGASAVSLRRFLHQPLFFPLDSFPPSASPQPQPQLQPKQPFSSSSTPQTQERPFFPSSSASPPPPPPPPTPSSYLVTFPANISSLLIPTSPSSSSSRHRFTAAVVSVTLLSVALLFALSALILLRYRRTNVGSLSVDKSCHVDGLRLVPSYMSSSDAVPTPSAGMPPCYASASSSSEFLDLGTLSSAANPYVDAASEAVASVDTSTSTLRLHQKLGSPELRPLPPLPRVPTNSSGETASFSIINDETRKEEECYQDDNDGEDQFFSPRGSSSQRDIPDSPDFRRAAMNPQRESEFLSQFEDLGLNLRNAFYPYKVVSGSSRNSVSSEDVNVASPLMDSSRLSQKSSSPEAVLKFLAPTHLLVRWAMPVNSPTLSSLSSSPVSDTNPHMSKASVETPPIMYPTRKPPPLPPPVPPPRFWENPICQDPSTGPPVLVVPSRTVMSSAPPPEQELQRSGRVGVGESSEETMRPKLKALHWDKVRASSDRAMVWDHIKSSSFQLNEEMIETLFVVNSLAQKENARRSVMPSLLNHENRVLDPKKSQNIAILLKALNVTIEEVCESLMEGNADSMGSELLESLLKMAPTKEEERKLKEFKDESPLKLGPAEKFLKALLDVPFAFKRVDAMLYITNFDAETEYLGQSFETLKAACGELKNSKLFLKLLEAVLKTGNRMNVGTNRGDARAFKLDTLLKLVDIKGKDGKTTLLHFVVQEIARIEGSELSEDNNKTINQSSLEFDVESRKLGLQVLSGLSGELTNVKKAATMDSCILSNEVAKLAGGLIRINDVIRMCCNERNEDVPASQFVESMKRFVSRAEQEIGSVQAEESAALSLVRELTEYFHGDSGKEEAHPFRIFLVVKDFVAILDRVCKEVGRINERSIYGLGVQFSDPSFPSVPSLFTEFSERREIAASRAAGYNSR